MRYSRVSVTRNETSRVSLTVPAWEIPILGLIYGDENIVDSGDTVDNDSDYPSAEAEFDRLSRRYKDNSETGVSFVGAIYGQGPAGIRALKAEIDEVHFDERPEDRPKAIGKVTPVTKQTTPPASAANKGTLSVPGKTTPPASEAEPGAKPIEE